jgi:UPF0755 protein
MKKIIEKFLKNSKEFLKKILKNKKLLIILGIVLILFILIIIFINRTAPTHRGQEKIVVIEKGWGSDEIAQKLKDEEIIKNKWFFVFYVWFRNYNKSLQAGEYLLTPEMNVFEVAQIIVKGKTTPNWVRVTVLEGWTNARITQHLINLGVIKPTEEIPRELEGHLFPDTYYFYKNSSVEGVIKKMRDNFDQHITKEIKEDIKKQGKTLYDILIMASILEKELITYEDKRIASGIFWRRINDNFPLQSCATVAYILGINKARYTYRDILTPSPYNTYLNTGLPPTPLNNPGLYSIKAAVYPIETDYYFFLSDPKTSKTIFSGTAQEHNQNKARYFK